MHGAKQETVVVIGGTSGIGLESAKALAKSGRRAIVTGRDQARAAKLRAEHPELQVEIVDAASREAMDTFFAKVGGFEHLVLSVSGAKGAGEFANLAEQDLREGFDQKFFAQVRAAQAALPHLSEKADRDGAGGGRRVEVGLAGSVMRTACRKSDEQ